MQRTHPELDEKQLFMLAHRLRYEKPVSEPPSPSASRSSTPHHLSDNDDDDDDSEEENNELRSSMNNSQSERSFTRYFERAKSTDNVYKNLEIEDINRLKAMRPHENNN